MKNKNLFLGIISLLTIAALCVIVVGVLLITSSNTTAEIPPTLDINTAIVDIAAAFTATSTQPTNTPAPTLTPTPYQTRTPLPTWTVSVTPSPFPTRTTFPTITPTRASEKPGDGMGTPTWIDEFETDSHWTLFDDECFKTDIRGGRYVQVTKGAPVGVCWEVTWPRIQDFYLETVARIRSNCLERDRYGIFFRGADNRRGYLFGLTCKQEYWLSVWNEETQQREKLIDYTVSDKIKITPGEVNKLGILTSHDRIVLYVNDALIAEVYDDKYILNGRIGFFIGSEITPNFTIEYDYWAYWANP